MRTKCVVILAAVVIAFGIMMTTGCSEKKKKCEKAPETKACEKAPAPAPAKK